MGLSIQKAVKWLYTQVWMHLSKTGRIIETSAFYIGLSVLCLWKFVYQKKRDTDSVSYRKNIFQDPSLINIRWFS